MAKKEKHLRQPYQNAFPHLFRSVLHDVQTAIVPIFSKRTAKA